MDYTKVWVKFRSESKIYYAGQTNSSHTARVLAHNCIKKIIGMKTYTYWGYYKWNGGFDRKEWKLINHTANLPIDYGCHA